MKKFKIILYIFIFHYLCSGGVSLSMQKVWNCKKTSFLYSAGFMKQSKNQFQYYEGGILVLPSIRSKVAINDTFHFSKEYIHSAYGVYGGYYFNLMSLFRPGILIGTTMRSDVVYKSYDNFSYFLNEYKDFRLDYYAAFSIQSGMFSFIISNYGIGGGLCYRF